MEGSSLPFTNSAIMAPVSKKPRTRYHADRYSFPWASVMGIDDTDPRYNITVQLTAPKDPDEECPIALDKISLDELPFLLTFTYSKTRPAFKKMTLPCGHGFGAMQLTYAFARTNMRCPMCRAGSEKPLNPECIPRHFRELMMKHIHAEKAKDRAEQNAQNMAVARTLVSDQLADIFRRATMSGPMITFFEYDSMPSGGRGLSVRPIMSAPLTYIHSSDIQQNGEFVISIAHRRAITRNLRFTCINNVSLGVSLRNLYDLTITLAHSPVFPMFNFDLESGTQTQFIPGSVGDFQVTTARTNGEWMIDNMAWRVNMGTLLRLIRDADDVM